MTKHLKTQPTLKPTRKVRAGGYVVAAATVAAYVVGAVQGAEIVSAEAATEALRILIGGLALLGTQWMTKEEA